MLIRANFMLYLLCFRLCSKCFIHIYLILQQPYDLGPSLTSLLQMRMLRQ